MNTPTHIVLSIAALTRSSRGDGEDSAPAQPTFLWPATIGAVLPDAPMFGFYAIEKFLIGSSEQEIWSTRYFLPAWQDVFDCVNSIPICLVALLVAWRMGRHSWSILLTSMLLHIACDLPVHHDDGHRHFWPLSDWRFESPVSYWDPKHLGMYFVPAELALFIGCTIVSFRRHRRLGIRIAMALMAVVAVAMSVLYLAMMVRQR